MRNTLFQTVVTSLAVLTIGVSLAATPVLAAARHGGGGRSGGSHHVAGAHRGGGAGLQYAGHRNGGGYYGGGGGYGHSYGGYGVGAGVAALATGALIGGAIASQNQGYYYGAQNYPGYSDPGYVYSNPGPVAYNNGNSVAYCEQTFRSYDPASGSYLGYDGFRHACP